ncbi:MAG: glycosyltransferase, partial [Kiritimatiellaeota bacterium]|nr:glycosyltransferase [Kiritimatiellota bacterium]
DLRVNPLILRLATRGAAAVAAISPAVRDMLGGAELVPNGIDTAAYAPAPRAPSPPCVAMVAQWAGWKRHGVFIRMAPRVREKFPGARFVIAPGTSGIDRRHEKKMRRLARGNGVDVAPPFDCAPSFFATLSVLVHPALEEPFGRVLYEALASGVPVAARRCAATRALVTHPFAGRLVDTDDAFAPAVADLLAQRRPENFAAQQAFCREAARAHDISRTADACAALYARILGRTDAVENRRPVVVKRGP